MRRYLVLLFSLLSFHLIVLGCANDRGLEASIAPPPDAPLGDGALEVGSDAGAPRDAGVPISQCGEVGGTALSPCNYDVARSKFAWGSAPVVSMTNGIQRWTGADGVLLITPFGFANGRMNAGAAASERSDWSSDETSQITHVRDYFITMGVPACQIAGTRVFLGAVSGIDGAVTQRTIHLDRAIDEIPILESIAYARLNDSDLSTDEGLFWPEISVDSLNAGRSFKTLLSTTSNLEEYKSRLPMDARGEGKVVIHHTGPQLSPSLSFQVTVTWDTLIGNQRASFSIDGQRVVFE